MPHILVTGGLGFIGGHLCERLIADGYTVTVCDNYHSLYALPRLSQWMPAIQQGAPLTVFPIDITDLPALRACFLRTHYDAVIHLAARAGVRSSFPMAPAYLHTNVEGTAHVLACCQEVGIRYIILASSSSVYGNHFGGAAHEDAPVCTPRSPYAASKRACELLAHAYAVSYGLHVASLRFFSVYGPWQRPDLVLPTFARLLQAGEPLPIYGDGQSRRDYTYVGDVVTGILQTLGWLQEQQAPYTAEVFNLGSGQPIDLLTLVQALVEATGCPADLHFLPVALGDVDTTHADLRKAQHLLRYNPATTFQEGLTAFLAWFRTQSSVAC